MPSSSPLSIAHLGHQYGHVGALDDLCIDVGSGEFVALLGPSGCGKTTLLRAVAGLVTPGVGTISIDGRIVTEDGSVRVGTAERGVGLVFQDYALFPHMTVAENIGYGLPTPEPTRVAGLIALVGIAGLEDRKPAELSGGQQQRVALARALAPRPSLLLLDEPFANVDAGLRDSLGRMLKRVVGDQGASVLMVTHDQDAALALADRVIVLEPGSAGGRVIQDAPPIEIYERPVTAKVAQLSGGAVFLPGEASGTVVQCAFGELPLLEPREGSVQLLMRPEQLHFDADPNGDVSVDEVQFHGAHHHLRCASPAGVLDALLPTSEPLPAVGSRGRIRVVGPVWALTR